MKRSPLALLALAVLFAAAPASAGSAQFGVGVFGGYNSYAMNDVNDDITNTNTTLGTSLDKINAGVGFGGGLRIRTSPSLLLSLDFERLTSSTSASGNIGGVGYDLDFSLPANAVIVGGTYYFPSASSTRFGVTGGVGYYWANGNINVSTDAASAKQDVSGNGVGFHGGGALDVSLSPTAHLEAMAGYRIAKTGDLEFDGVTSPGESAEWSGFMSRAGFSFFFGNH
jgi:outer membrane protein with beta-barrel domain